MTVIAIFKNDLLRRVALYWFTSSSRLEAAKINLVVGAIIPLCGHVACVSPAVSDVTNVRNGHGMKPVHTVMASLAYLCSRCW